MKPVRLQLSRRKGFSLQRLSRETNGLDAVNVARPSKWGNPFRVGEASPRDGSPMTASEAVAWYRMGLWSAARVWTGRTGNYLRPEMDAVYQAWEARRPHLHAVALETDLPQLAGKNLACFCRLDQPCHADVLLDLANPTGGGE